METRKGEERVLKMNRKDVEKRAGRATEWEPTVNPNGSEIKLER